MLLLPCPAQGLTTIQAYRAQHHFHDAFLRHLARNSSWYWSYLGAVRWNGMAVDSILVVLLALVLALIIVLANKVGQSDCGVHVWHGLSSFRLAARHV
jgi:hypothetical protein